MRCPQSIFYKLSAVLPSALAENCVNVMARPRTHFSPTPQQLTRGIVHICYEYCNLLSAAYWDLHGVPPWRTHCDDAFLLGYRKMSDFLLNTRRSAARRSGDIVELSDILASDYLPDGITPTWDLPTWRLEWRDAMNRQLAHLSFDRDEEWVHFNWVPKLESEFRAAWTAFMQALAPEYRPVFEGQIEKKRISFKPVQL